MVRNKHRVAVIGSANMDLTTFVDEFPRLASGKIDKKELRAPYWAGQSRLIN